MKSWKAQADLRSGSLKYRELQEQIRNEWDLRINQEIPINLSTELENGNSELSLGSSLLKTLALNTNNGNTRAELTGNQSLLEQVNITHLNGNILLTLSGDYPSLSGMT